MNPAEPKERFLRACRCLPTDRTPIWLMRQAGRYLPEYRALRAKYGMLEIIRTPELAVEATLQPLRLFDLDAAIIFSDILPVLQGMGLSLDFVEGEGPRIFNPIRTPAEIERLRTVPAEEGMPGTLEAIKIVRGELKGTPLIGFCGAPYTMAVYAMGGNFKDSQGAKTLMTTDPRAWGRLMEKLTVVLGDYLLAQARAGAQALQIFDSLAGTLSPDEYRNYVLPHSRRLIATARESGVPLIHFAFGAGGFLEQMAEAGSDVIGVDWMTDLDEAWKRIGHDRALQGNLDPNTLLTPWDFLREKAAEVLQKAGGRRGHIFNLGHGVDKKTPVDNVKRLVDFVHEHAS